MKPIISLNIPNFKDYISNATLGIDMKITTGTLKISKAICESAD